MNVVTAISKIFAQPISEVAAIVAGVPKPPALVDAERELLEIAASEAMAISRLKQISERLDYKKINEVVFKPEQDALEAERGRLNRERAALQERAALARKQVEAAMPAYAAALQLALAPNRRAAAKKLIEAVGQIEASLRTITESSAVLLSAGLAPTRGVPLPYAGALRGLGARVLKETQ